MIRRIKERNYKFRHSLATIVVDEVEVGVSDKGRRTLSIQEIDRLTNLAILKFLEDNYFRSMNPGFTLNAKQVRAIMAFLKVTQKELGLLVGCQKSKVSKILRGEQKISSSQAMLAIERVALELVRPGAIRSFLGDENVVVGEPKPEIVSRMNQIRGFEHSDAA